MAEFQVNRGAQTRRDRRGDQAGGPSLTTRQPSRSTERRPKRPMEHPYQSAVADMLSLDNRWPGRCADSRLSLRFVMARLRTHPGEVLREEYLIPLGMSARALAKSLGVPANRITEIMRGERDVSADTAIRLGRYFRTDPRFWLNLQSAYNLSKAQGENDYSKVRPSTAA